MNASNRLLWHTIDAATPRSRKRSGLGGTVFVLAITLVFCALALYKDGVFA